MLDIFPGDVLHSCRWSLKDVGLVFVEEPIHKLLDLFHITVVDGMPSLLDDLINLVGIGGVCARCWSLYALECWNELSLNASVNEGLALWSLEPLHVPLFRCLVDVLLQLAQLVLMFFVQPGNL